MHRPPTRLEGVSVFARGIGRAKMSETVGDPLEAWIHVSEASLMPVNAGFNGFEA